MNESGLQNAVSRWKRFHKTVELDLCELYSSFEASTKPPEDGGQTHYMS